MNQNTIDAIGRYNLCGCTIPVSPLFDPEKPESSNNGNYRAYMQFASPCVGTYRYREFSSYHSDIEPMPEWEEVTCVEYYQRYKTALRLNAEAKAMEQTDFR